MAEPYAPGSKEWWIVRQVANGDQRRSWYELTDEDRAALVARFAPSSPIPRGGLTSEERFLLDWLSKDDTSLLGECEGQALTVLINCGLAKVEHRERGGRAEVSLTEAGIAEFREPTHAR